jgi:hypothetical protein
MKNPSLKMDEHIFHETERSTATTSKNRNEGVEFNNMLQKRKVISRQLLKESKMVQKESMKILAELEKLQNGD